MTLAHERLAVSADLARRVYAHPRDWLVHQGVTTTWIAFEGSDELADWRRNFEFFLTSSSEHLGFGSYARELMGQMLAAGVHLDATKPLILCGHSLGGAVATIIAAQLQAHLPKIELVTFGSPRPGGAKFAKRLKVPHYRYRHADDVVPTLPSALLGFRHTAPALQLEPSHPGHFLKGIADHDMAAYQAILSEPVRQ